jgi:MFS family permease
LLGGVLVSAQPLGLSWQAIFLINIPIGLAMLPFAFGYFFSSLASPQIMQRLGVRALTLGFVIQVLCFGSVMLAVSKLLAGNLEIGLVVAGIGFGIVMPSIIKAVIGGVDARYAGLASGMVISTFQIGASLGVATIGGVFYSALGAASNASVYAHAFTLALGCNVILLILGAILSLGLADTAPAAGVPREPKRS